MHAFLLLIATTFAAPPSPAAPVPRAHLLIDRSTPAYTVLTLIPADAAAGVHRQIDGRAGVELRRDTDLARAVAEVWRAQVRRDDYEVDMTGRLPALLHGLPLTPIGLSWNGGIAVTHGDYRHAEREYARWQAAPQNYSPPARARDPLDPSNHLRDEAR